MRCIVYHPQLVAVYHQVAGNTAFGWWYTPYGDDIHAKAWWYTKPAAWIKKEVTFGRQKLLLFWSRWQDLLSLIPGFCRRPSARHKRVSAVENLQKRHNVSFSRFPPLASLGCRPSNPPSLMQKKKAVIRQLSFFGRDDRTWTCGILLPKPRTNVLWLIMRVFESIMSLLACFSVLFVHWFHCLLAWLWSNIGSKYNDHSESFEDQSGQFHIHLPPSV